jgi:hypothetical protein
LVNRSTAHPPSIVPGWLAAIMSKPITTRRSSRLPVSHPCRALP